jgi:hypothetical protein
MTAPLKFPIKSTILARRRLLTVHPDCLSFDDKDLISAKPTCLEKANIESFRFGVDWISGFYFTIGRTYRIEVRDHEGATVKILLRSIYGVRKKKLADKYRQIYNALHNAYFNDLGLHYIRLVNDRLPFHLAGVMITADGIEDSKIGALPWNSIGLRAYTSYFAIFDKSDPSKYHAFDYGIEWNAVLLYSVLEYILREKQN